VDATRITLVIEGPEKDGGHIRLEVFASQLRLLSKTLARADEVVGQGTRNTHFAVVGLSHSSPATVELEQRVNRGKQDRRPQIVERVIREIESAERGEIHVDTDYKLLADLRGLIAPVGDAIKSSLLKLNGSSIELTADIAKKIDVQLAEHESCIATFEGMLERINVHDDANIFTIYPDVGPNSVTCHFPVDYVETAVSAVKKRVAVTGLARYRKLTPYPYQIDVSDIEIYDPEDTLPSFDDIRGLAPNATGEESAADFVARFRDGWV
jgi:hypothetical protein